LWDNARLPGEGGTAYVVVAGQGARRGDEAGYALLLGLSRRLGGNCRRPGPKDWADPRNYPAVLLVYASHALPPEEVLRLLTPQLPDLELIKGGGTRYRLESEAVTVRVLTDPECVFPQVRRQPWYSSPGATVEYAAMSDEDPANQRQAAEVAQRLAKASSALLLDEDGFPWEDSPTPA